MQKQLRVSVAAAGDADGAGGVCDSSGILSALTEDQGDAFKTCHLWISRENGSASLTVEVL